MITVVPEATAWTTPVELLTVAVAGVLLDHVSVPVVAVSVSTRLSPGQTDVPPPIALGCAVG